MKRATKIQIKNEALRMFLATSSLILTAMLVNPATGDWPGQIDPRDRGTLAQVGTDTLNSNLDPNLDVKEETKPETTLQKKLGLEKLKVKRSLAKLR